MLQASVRDLISTSYAFQDVLRHILSSLRTINFERLLSSHDRRRRDHVRETEHVIGI